jgi:hypothetical protein
MASSTLRRRLEQLEAQLTAPSNITLEDLVNFSMRQEPLDDETERRLANSRLGRLVIAAAANHAPVAAAPIPAPAVPPQSQPAFSLARMVEDSFSEAAVPAAPSWEAPPIPPSVPTAEEQRSAPPPPPVHETGRDRFWQRSEIFDSCYADSDLIPAQPGLSLAALMAEHRRNGKDR